MKARDLMVGDCVHYKMDLGKDGIYEKDIRINNIYGSHVNCELRDYEIISGKSCSDLSPILLTPKILEKNGFTNCETSELDREMGNEFWYPGEDNYISDPDLMINLEKHNFLVRFTGSIVWKLHYVHELQHFLRLVNYDKEIVL